jgi:hypothetical protein
MKSRKASLITYQDLGYSEEEVKQFHNKTFDFSQILCMPNPVSILQSVVDDLNNYLSVMMARSVSGLETDNGPCDPEGLAFTPVKILGIYVKKKLDGYVEVAGSTIDGSVFIHFSPNMVLSAWVWINLFNSLPDNAAKRFASGKQNQVKLKLVDIDVD